jgi:hypothetical protein
MADRITLKEQVERRTYLKGRFFGKYIGYLDHKSSDLSHELFYDIEVIGGEVSLEYNDEHIQHWEKGEPQDFQPIEKFLTKLPDTLPVEIKYSDGTVKNFYVNLNEPKLSNYTLSKQVYEKDLVFGDIAGEISGYIKHYDIHDVEVLVSDESPDGPPTQFSKTKTLTRTGRTEDFGHYKRWEYFYSDGTTYWGAWIRQNRDAGFSWLDLIRGLFLILLLVVVGLPLLSFGWRIILPILFIVGIYFLLSMVQVVLIRFWSWILRFVGLAFLVFLIFSCISLFKNSDFLNLRKKYATNSDEEVQSISTDPITGDKVISHFRIWQDYDGREYSGKIKVTVRDVKEVSNHRNSIVIEPQDQTRYNTIVSKIYDFDKGRLMMLYAMFDSLRLKYKLGKHKFAEVITSCIQDIPYTLVLDNDCNANRYTDKFIKDYLNSGGKCQGFVKFGLLAPTEFMGSLIGDCDTRTLLVFTVLAHYGYDAVMLSSDVYRHSVIGINLPYTGVAKSLWGKKYVIWETTAQGLRPGAIPREISDMRYWNVTLRTKNSK